MRTFLSNGFHVPWRTASMTPEITYKSSNLFDIMFHQNYTFTGTNLKTIRVLSFLRYCANVIKLNAEHEGSMSVLRKTFKIQFEEWPRTLMRCRHSFSRAENLKDPRDRE